MESLIQNLIIHGGKIVCTSSLSVLEVAEAEADNRRFIFPDGTAIVWVPPVEFYENIVTFETN